MNIKHLLIVGLSLYTSLAMAVTFPLEVEGQEAIYQTSIPSAVYRYSQTMQLQDIQITNGHGERVPHAVIPSSLLYPEIRHNQQKSLQVFPVQAQALNSPEQLRLQLQQAGQQTTLSLSQAASADARAIFLVDLGEQRINIEKLVLDWSGELDQLIELEVLASENLLNWQTVGRGAVLKTSQSAEQLQLSEIQTSVPTSARYLQLRTAKPGQQFTLSNLTAIMVDVQQTPVASTWQTLALSDREQDKKTASTRITFEADGRYPASLLHIGLPEDNTITRVSIYNKINEKDDWRLLTHAPVYRISKDGKTQQQPDIRISPSTARYWQLQFHDADGGIGQQNPELALGWPTQRLLWNARGTGPFNLQLASSDIPPRQTGINHLYPNMKSTDLQKIPEAPLRLDTHQIEQTPTAWETPRDNKVWVLWGGLLLGVLALLGMVWSLVRNPPGTTPS